MSRRQFVKGVAAGSVIAGLEFGGVRPLFGESGFHTPPTLTGNHFELTVDKLPVNITGKRSVATAVNGSVAGPTFFKYQPGSKPSTLCVMPKETV